MCSVCPPPSLPGPNWGGLTSWPELNWVVVPVAGVSFSVSQGGLHSHCVRHCIVQAGCNQADESSISRNTLRAFFMSKKCCEILTHACTHAELRVDPQIKPQECTVILYARTYTHSSLHSPTQQEFIWWIRKGPSCWEFVMFCLFMSIKSLVECRCDVSLAVLAEINLFLFFLISYDLVFLLASCFL